MLEQFSWVILFQGLLRGCSQAVSWSSGQLQAWPGQQINLRDWTYMIGGRPSSLGWVDEAAYCLTAEFPQEWFKRESMGADLQVRNPSL